MAKGKSIEERKVQEIDELPQGFNIFSDNPKEDDKFIILKYEDIISKLESKKKEADLKFMAQKQIEKDRKK